MTTDEVCERIWRLFSSLPYVMGVRLSRENCEALVTAHEFLLLNKDAFCNFCDGCKRVSPDKD